MFTGGKNYCSPARYRYCPCLINTLDVDIDTVFSIIAIFVYNFSFAPGGISDHVHFQDLRAELPQEAIVSHPVCEKYITPCLGLLSHNNLPRMRRADLVSWHFSSGLPLQKALAELPLIDALPTGGRRHLFPHDTG